MTDMKECELRDEFGHPHLPYPREPRPHGPITKPRSGIKLQPGSAVGGALNLDQSNGKTLNPAIPWIIATGVCALSIGLVLGVVLGADGRIQAEGRAIRAEVSEEFAQRLARQDAVIAETKQKADLAMDWTNQKNAELKAYRSAK